jgi:hypothetical protein
MKLTMPPTAVRALCRPRLGVHRVHANAMMRARPLCVKLANLILAAVCRPASSVGESIHRPAMIVRNKFGVPKRLNWFHSDACPRPTTPSWAKPSPSPQCTAVIKDGLDATTEWSGEPWAVRSFSSPRLFYTVDHS